VDPGAKAEDSVPREARSEKWESSAYMRTAATTPRPPRGEDEGEVEETAQSNIDVLR